MQFLYNIRSGIMTSLCYGLLHRVKLQDSEVSSDQQQLDSIFQVFPSLMFGQMIENLFYTDLTLTAFVFVQLLEKIIFTFVKKELKRLHRVLVSDYPECLESEEDEEQSSREAFLNITLDFLKRMDQEQLVRHLWSSKNSV